MSKKILYFIILCLLVVIVWAVFRPIFSGAWILPQTFSIGTFSVHYYGITMALAVGAGWWLAMQRTRKYGVDLVRADSFLLWLVCGGFVGARLYHVASSWQYYIQYPLDIVKVWHGGLSIYGGLLGGLVVVVVFAKRLGLTASLPSETSQKSSTRLSLLLRILDWLAPSVVLGQIIGRFGNFFNYEAFGYPTSLPWKMFVPLQFRPNALAQSQYFHPLFLYEALGNLVILLLLLNLDKKGLKERKWRSGTLFFTYLFLYNVLRFGVELLRADSTFVWHNIRLNSISSAFLALVGIAGVYIVRTLYEANQQHSLE